MTQRTWQEAYDDVPAVPADAEPDPHWAESRTLSGLPGAYMPPAMRGEQPRWRKVSAVVIITMLVSATAGGVCLTYGPAELFRLIS